jgi:NAD-dependent DNA ligase
MSEKNKSITELIKIVEKENYEKYIKSFSINELVKILKKLSDSYYNSEPIVDDDVFDDIKEMLIEKDPENSYLDEVGANVKSKNKVKLPYEMNSLKKIKPFTGNVETLCDKFDGPFVLSDKLDGISIQLYKNENGVIKLYTRGNGIEGTDITNLSKYVLDDSVNNIPNNTSIRGELIISNKNFKKIDYMKNVRNSVGGLVNAKTIDKNIAKLTEMVVYSVMHPRMKQSDQLKKLKEWDLNVVDYTIVDSIDDDYMMSYLLDRKEKSKYDIDGIVCIDDSKIHNLGQINRKYPDHAYAFKMVIKGQIKTVTVTDIKWNISMDGYIKPTILIEPVEIQGSIVSKTTGFNAKYIVDNCIGKGSILELVKSGDVIPYILKIIKKTKPMLPKYGYVWNNSKVDFVIDKNDKETQKLITLKILYNFFSKIGVKHLGENTLLKFLNIGLNTIPKILNAKEKDFENVSGLGKKSVTKIYNEIYKAFDTVDLVTFMGASHKFGRGIASKKIEEILKIYPNLLKEEWSKNEMIEKIKEINGFAEKTATLFSENFNKFGEFYNEISKIVDISRFENIKTTKPKNKKFVDVIIVFTGKKYPDYEKMIKEGGGKVTTTVTSNTTILVYTKDEDTVNSKYIKAKKLKTVEILHADEFKMKFIN